MLPSPTCDLSIIIPVYYNEQTLRPTLDALRSSVVNSLPARRCEIIFVNDGSGDNSLAMLRELQGEFPELVRVINLSRNFGQSAAIEAGYRLARGRYLVEMSADCQDPPELINDMWIAHTTEGCDVVIAARGSREESFYRRLTSQLFYGLIRRLSFPEMPPGGFDFVSLSRRATSVLLTNMEAHPFFQGQVMWLGFPRKILYYHRRDRSAGQSRWTFSRKLTYMLDGVLAYSFFPLRCVSGLGVLFALCGFTYAVVIFISKLLGGIPVEGWAPLMIVMLVMGGIQLLTLGLIGEYLWRTLAQVRNRDRYIISEVWEQPVVTSSPA